MEERALGNRLLDSLPARERQRFLDAGPFYRKIRAGTVLQHQGEPVVEVYFPTRGVASHVLHLADGKAAEVGLSGNAEMIGLGAWLGSRRAGADVHMQTDGAAITLPVNEVVAVTEDCPHLTSQLLALATQKYRETAQLVACNAAHTAIDRLARWIRSMSVRCDAPEFPVTHELLASTLGVRRPTLTVAAGQLRDAGAIDNRRGRIVVLDHELLRSLACECSETVDALYGPPAGGALRSA